MKREKRKFGGLRERNDRGRGADDFYIAGGGNDGAQDREEYSENGTVRSSLVRRARLVMLKVCC